MEPEKRWIETREAMADRLSSPVDLNEYFESCEVAGVPVRRMCIGACSLPTGRIEGSDPLMLLGIDDAPYLESCPPGEYETEVCVIPPMDGDCARYAAVRIRFGGDRAVRHSLALVGDEDLEGLEEDGFFGFQVGSGLACIADMAVAEAYSAFLDGWYNANPDKDVYQDYFADMFMESARSRPEYQRPEGDWIVWRVPGTGYSLPMFLSGFGDGIYPVYWGYDSDGRICEVVAQFIDIALAYTEA